MLQHPVWMKLFFVSVVTFLITFTIFTQTSDNKERLSVTQVFLEVNNNSNKGQLYCYRSKSEALKDISKVKPRPDKSIFFHETSCRSSIKGKIYIGARQACAVESAARMHPNMDIYLLFSSPGVFKFEGDEADRMLQVLTNYSNVNILHLDYENYIKGSPVEELYKGGLIEKNDEYAVAHASDILRYLTLWKYGGIYLDTDVVVIKSLEDLAPNYSGTESEEDIAAGVFKFSSTGFGHKMVEDCLKYLKQHFDPYEWSGSSVGVISRVAKENCNVSQTSDLFSKGCGEFKLYPMETFYAVHYSVWPMFFNEEDTESVLKMTKHSYAIHLWNKLSSDHKVSKKASTAYNYFAKKYCPKVFAEIVDQF